jgi:hypothetical protein
MMNQLKKLKRAELNSVASLKQGKDLMSIALEWI